MKHSVTVYTTQPVQVSSDNPLLVKGAISKHTGGSVFARKVIYCHKEIKQCFPTWGLYAPHESKWNIWDGGRIEYISIILFSELGWLLCCGAGWEHVIFEM